MKVKFIVVIFLFLIAGIGFASAAPPFQSSESTIGVQVEVPIIEYHTFNYTNKFHVHAYNATSGLLLTNTTTTCLLHIYKPTTGGHLIEANMTFDSNLVDFEYEVLGTNFTELGHYPVLLYCYVPGEIGGFLEYSFEVTMNGSHTPSGIPTLQVGLILIIFLIACFWMFLSVQFNEVAFKIFFLIVSLVFLFATILTAYVLSTSSNIIASVSTSILSLVTVTGTILIIVFIYFLIRLTVNALDLYNIKRGKTWNVGRGSSVAGFNTKRAY